MFENIARFVVHRRWWVIGAWVVVAVALVAFAPKFKVSTEQTDFLPKHYDSVQAFELASKAFPQAKGQTAFIVVNRPDGQALTADDEKKVAEFTTALQNKHIPDITEITPGPVSENRQVQMIPVRFASENWGDPKTTKALEELREHITHTTPAGTQALVTGEAAINADSQESYEESDRITLMATVIVIFILLIFTFRSIVAALLPLFTVGLVMMVALSIIGTVNAVFDLKGDNLTQSLMPIVLFGVGTDYILFLLFRYRERLRAGEDSKAAMVSAVHRVGEVIAASAAAVIIAFSALILASLGMLKSMGPAMAVAIATTLIAALTLIPAVVSLLGPKVFWPSKSWKQEPKHTTSARIGSLIGRRPLPVAIVSGLVLLLLSLAVLSYKPNYDLASAPENTEAAKGLTVMEKGFPPGAQMVTQVFVRSTNGAPLPAGEVDAVANKLRGAKGVGQVAAPKESADKSTALIEIQLTDNPLSETAMDNVGGPIRTAAAQGVTASGVEVLVGGTTAVMVDLESAMNRDYKVVFPIAGLLIAIVLALLLRSLIAPLYLMTAVVLSFLGTIGAGVLLFQGAYGHSGVLFFLPIVVYLFVVALGTDYNILMIARLREEAKAGHPPREAVARAFPHAAPTVASAGLILAGSFATFLLASADMMQEMGVSVAIGVILSAFVMSMFLVPAVTVLLGHRAWWPGHGDAPDPEAVADEQARERVGATV